MIKYRTTHRFPAEMIKEDLAIYMLESFNLYKDKAHMQQAEKVIDLIIEQSQKYNWISVDAGLPDNPLQDSFIVYTSEGIIEGNALYNDGWMFWSPTGWKTYGDDVVTHWLYLPPPNSEKKE